MLKAVIDRLRTRAVNACLCTLAIHEPYRKRALQLLADAPSVPWIVLTDEPDDFASLPVRAIRHSPTGPMAIDFLTNVRLGENHGKRPAYHDKRFVLEAALKDFDTAIFVDADTRIRSLPRLPSLKPGITVTKELRSNIVEHLSRWGTGRLTAFEQLAIHFTGTVETLKVARWCGESLFAITKDGNESKFFEAWAQAADFLREREVFTGEGGVIGLAAVCAGWTVDYKRLGKLARVIQHEGLGPKST